MGGIYRGGELGREFLFPSGRRCKTFDDLVRGCSEEWLVARDMLRQGGLRQFFAGVGRMDLALLAEQSARQPDADIALEQFLAKLPTRELIGPRLDLVPRRLNLGRLRVGESRQYQIRIMNHGSGLLHGSLQVEGDDWITLELGINGTLPIKTGKQQQLSIYIDTVGLVAGQKYSAKLVVITNGGVVEVPVNLELAAVPFPHPPLQGAMTPRDLAARMRDAPKQVGVLLESGEVQRWFAQNGWQYPIHGAPAKGVAGVQQFFEGLGLSKPPPLEVTPMEVLLRVRAGQSVQGHVVLRTAAKKWVYARIESDTPWLTVLQEDVGGAQLAPIEFQASSKRLETNQVHEGQLNIVANGGQRLTVPVRLEVLASRLPLAGQAVRGLVVGALSGLLFRTSLSLFFFVVLLGTWALAPLFGRSDVTSLRLLSTGAWVRDPPADYLRIVTMSAGLAGIPLGAWVLRKRSGAKDVFAGMLVGGVTGLILGLTLGSVLSLLEKAMWVILPVDSAGVAVSGWTLWGAALGLLCAGLGSAGQALLAFPAQLLRDIAQRAGFHRLAEWLEQ